MGLWDVAKDIMKKEIEVETTIGLGPVVGPAVGKEVERQLGLDDGKKEKNGPDGKGDPAGREGPAGPAGPAGPEGKAGPGGPEGKAGPAGPAGPAGQGGPAGPEGKAGPGGPEGKAGQVGPAGPEGKAGQVGPAGPEGKAGQVGPTGPEGKEGPAGPAGPPGSGPLIQLNVTVEPAPDGKVAPAPQPQPPQGKDAPAPQAQPPHHYAPQKAEFVTIDGVRKPVEAKIDHLRGEAYEVDFARDAQGDGGRYTVKFNDHNHTRTMSFHDPMLDANGKVMNDANGEPVHHPYADGANQLQDNLAQDRKREAEAGRDFDKARDGLKGATARGEDDKADRDKMGADLLAKEPHKYALDVTSDGKWTPAEDTKGTVTMSVTDGHPSEPHEPIQARSGPPVDVAQAQPQPELAVGGR